MSFSQPVLYPEDAWTKSVLKTNFKLFLIKVNSGQAIQLFNIHKGFFHPDFKPATSYKKSIAFCHWTKCWFSKFWKLKNRKDCNSPYGDDFYVPADMIRACAVWLRLAFAHGTARQAITYEQKRMYTSFEFRV